MKKNEQLMRWTIQLIIYFVLDERYEFTATFFSWFGDSFGPAEFKKYLGFVVLIACVVMCVWNIVMAIKVAIKSNKVGD